VELHNFDFSRKIFFHPEKVHAAATGERPFPTTLEVDLTNRCNHRCSFCFYAEHIATDRSTLDGEVIRARLTEARKLGTRGVSFTGGGEPTLHPEFLDVVAHARAVGLDVGLITNGSALTERAAEALVRDLTWVRVSMGGGDAASYARVQGTEHFERVLENVARLLRIRDAAGEELNVGLRTLVTPENLDSIAGFAETAAALGVDYLQLAPDQEGTDGGAFWNAPATQAVFAAAEGAVAGTATRLLTTRYMMDQPGVDRPSACWAHFFMLAITAEGDVMFCKNARGAERFVLGNLNDKGLAEIWRDVPTRALEGWVKPSNCGLFCKHMAINLAMEEVVSPDPDMSPNFVG
jgi:radical SAM protein with 4Fe4S-binding SPASM domain